MHKVEWNPGEGGGNQEKERRSPNRNRVRRKVEG
jgi:hypothetical protein